MLLRELFTEKANKNYGRYLLVPAIRPLTKSVSGRFFAKKEKIWYNRDRKKQGETAYDD